MSVPPKFFLFKRSNGIYYVGFGHEGRRRWKSTGCTQKTGALRAITNLSSLLTKTPRPIRLSEFRDQLVSFLSTTHAKSSVALFRLALQQLIHLTNDCTVSALTYRHVDQYKESRLHVVGPHSVNRELRTLRAALNVAVRWQHIDRNPFSGVQMVRVPDVRPCYFRREEFDKLMMIIQDGWLKELVVFSVATGMRQSEMLNLKWSDVDLDGRVMQVQSGPTFKTKGGRRRTIPMSDTVYTMLAAKAAQASSDFVFVRKGRKIGGSYLTHRFKKYVRIAGLDARLHWHSLRHTHASWLVQCGVSLYEVQKLLGHSSSKITEVYSHLQPEQLHSTVNRIEVSLN